MTSNALKFFYYRFEFFLIWKKNSIRYRHESDFVWVLRRISSHVVFLLFCSSSGILFLMIFVTSFTLENLLQGFSLRYWVRFSSFRDSITRGSRTTPTRVTKVSLSPTFPPCSKDLLPRKTPASHVDVYRSVYFVHCCFFCYSPFYLCIQNNYHSSPLFLRNRKLLVLFVVKHVV